MRRLVISVTATVLTMLGLLVWKAGGTAKSAAARVMSNAVVRTGTGGNGTTVVTGPQVVLAHGIVQVRATIAADGRIIDVTALSLPHDNPHSYGGSTAAAVKLRTEVLTKQSAKVDIVSGATYTSHGYISSLQAALDAAGRH